MRLLVIHEVDLSDSETDVVGVVDSVEKAGELIQEYYGEHLVISNEFVNFHNIECKKIIEVRGYQDDPYRVEIILEWFELNSL